VGPKHVSRFFLSVLLLAWAGPAAADQYRADEFLSLDLSKAVLSPKRLGPPAQFAPVAVEARNDAMQPREEPSVDYRPGVRTTKVKQADSDDAQMRAEPKADRKVVRTTRVKPEPVAKPERTKPERIAKPRVPARAKVVRRHGNPLDAQAMDTRIQKWPCKSGGICDWKR
jgi:outer membrane biosynthesis protein TonB